MQYDDWMVTDSPLFSVHMKKSDNSFQEKSKNLKLKEEIIMVLHILHNKSQSMTILNRLITIARYVSGDAKCASEQKTYIVNYANHIFSSLNKHRVCSIFLWYLNSVLGIFFPFLSHTIFYFIQFLKLCKKLILIDPWFWAGD